MYLGPMNRHVSKRTRERGEREDLNANNYKPKRVKPWYLMEWEGYK